MQKLVTLMGAASLLLGVVVGAAQDRDPGPNKDSDRIARLDSGTVIPVRTADAIDSDRGDGRVYSGNVDQDVRNERGRVVIPRGSGVELMVRVAPDNVLILDVESVMVDGERYAIRTDPRHIDAKRRDDVVISGLVAALDGAASIDGGSASGPRVRIPRNVVVTFKLQRPLEMGVKDNGGDRDGHHYHDESDRIDPERDTSNPNR